MTTTSSSRKTRVLRGVVTAISLALVLATPTLAVDSAQAKKAKGEPITSTLRVVTYNVSADVSVRKTVRDLEQITSEAPDVIALQEMSSWKRRQAVRAAYVDCETCMYDAWIPVPAVPGGQPILYRSDRYTLIGYGMRQVTKDTYVGPRGAGPSTMRARWITWVRLRDIATGRQVYVLNNHFVPTVQASDGGPNHQRKRVRLYRKHMEALVAMIQEVKATTGGTVFVTGDFNVNYRGDSVVQAPMFPYAALGAIGVTSTYQNLWVPEEGTHVLGNGFSKRLIDYVFNRKARSVSPQSQHIIFGLSSDHRPLVADYAVYARGCFAKHQNICVTTTDDPE